MLMKNAGTFLFGFAGIAVGAIVTTALGRHAEKAPGP
jgi:hypothetical protein